jgi:hypothetical protein
VYHLTKDQAKPCGIVPLGSRFLNMLTSIFLVTLVFAYGENLGDDNTDFVQMTVPQREANDPCQSECPANVCNGPEDACKPECQECAACHGTPCKTAASVDSSSLKRKEPKAAAAALKGLLSEG